MRVASHNYAPIGSRLRGNEVQRGTTEFGMLCSALSESSACDVPTQTEKLCVVTTHNRDQEV